MSDEKTPQRPEGMSSGEQRPVSAPRLEVEPTPVPPAGSEPTTQIPQHAEHAAADQAGQTHARPYAAYPGER